LFAALAEGEAGDVVEALAFGGGEGKVVVAFEADNSGSDIGRRPEAGGLDELDEGDGVELLEGDGEGADGGGAGLGGEAFGDFLLEEDDDAGGGLGLEGGIDDDAGADGVGEVGDEAGDAFGGHGGMVDVEGVAVAECEARFIAPPLAEDVAEAAVHFNGSDFSGIRKQLLCQCTEAGTNFEDVVLPRQLRRVDDNIKDVPVDKKVLPKRMAGRKPGTGEEVLDDFGAGEIEHEEGSSGVREFRSPEWIWNC